MLFYVYIYLYIYIYLDVYNVVSLYFYNNHLTLTTSFTRSSRCFHIVLHIASAWSACTGSCLACHSLPFPTNTRIVRTRFLCLLLLVWLCFVMGVWYCGCGGVLCVLDGVWPSLFASFHYRFDSRLCAPHLLVYACLERAFNGFALGCFECFRSGIILYASFI